MQDVEATNRRRLTERPPLLYPFAVEVVRMKRKTWWLRSGVRVARGIDRTDLSYRPTRHKSLPLRTLGESEMWLQNNEARNRRLVADRIDDLIIQPEDSFDPFADHGRVLPWGVGCAVYDNDVDLRFRKDTDALVQLGLRVGERHLEGELRSSVEAPRTGSWVRRELVKTNCALVRYEPDPADPRESAGSRSPTEARGSQCHRS